MNNIQKNKTRIMRLNEHMMGILTIYMELCSEPPGIRDSIIGDICGEWKGVSDSMSAIRIFKDGQYHKITITERSKILRKCRETTYLINGYYDGSCYINTVKGQIDMVYDRLKGTLFLSPGGEYVRKDGDLFPVELEIPFEPIKPQ